MKKAREEIYRVFEEKKKTNENLDFANFAFSLKYEEISELEYCGMIIKESLRRDTPSILALDFTFTENIQIG